MKKLLLVTGSAFVIAVLSGCSTTPVVDNSYSKTVENPIFRDDLKEDRFQFEDATRS